MEIRFYIDDDTGLPHIYEHGVRETEVADVLRRAVEDRLGSGGARVALGPTQAGRLLRVVYVPDPGQESVFVVTAYDLRGKPLAAFRRRGRRRSR
jgi:hypothetical protein